MPKTKVKIEAPTSVTLLPNGHIRSFGGDDRQMSQLRKGWLVVWLESLEAKGINPLEIEKIEAVVNGELVRIKPFKKEGVWGYSTHVLDLYDAWKYDKQIDLNDTFSLTGFDSKEKMTYLVQSWKDMSGNNVPFVFDDRIVYCGEAKKCKPKEEWLEKAGEMDSGGIWFKPYDGSVYCKNHFKWAFESALKVLGNPAYIIVLDKVKINKYHENL
jgi:hypothetical protein